MIRTYLRNQRGAAAVEFAMMLGIFTIALPSAVDLGIYAYDSMQVVNSAQAGAQAAWAACTQFPITAQCSAGQSAISTAVQQTTLRNAVTVSSVTEGYYCTNASGVLALDGSTGTYASPLNSNSVGACPSGSKTTLPGDYVNVNVTYTYTPVFAHISVASLLGTTITGQATMRLL